MKLQPVVYTTDMGRTVGWYEAVLDVDPPFRSDMWTAFPVDGATLGIHHVEGPLPEGSRVHLSLVATESLESLIERLEGVGIELESGIEDQPFGRSFLLRDPEGNPIQVNEHRHQE